MPDLRSKLKSASSVRECLLCINEVLCDWAEKINQLDRDSPGVSSTVDMIAASRDVLLDTMDALNDEEGLVHKQLAESLRVTR